MEPSPPRHLAIIMDGNGRWAQSRGLPRVEGHREGAESVSTVVRACRERGVQVLTLYSFSTENWKRPKDEVRAFGADGQPVPLSSDLQKELLDIRERLSRRFTRTEGFDRIVRLNFLDGIRIWFANGDVAHVRPSGNADELRIYAVADTQERADQIVKLGVAEPNGILRRLEKAVD